MNARPSRSRTSKASSTSRSLARIRIPSGTAEQVAHRPIALVALAAVGFAISAYLAAFELGFVADPWDPFFGDGSRRVLTSAIARLLPVPDATVGAAAYLVDGFLGVVLLARPRGRLVVASALALIASAGAVVAFGLVVIQTTVVHALCTLCLASAAVSVALAVGALAEWRARRRDQANRNHPSEEAVSP